MNIIIPMAGMGKRMRPHTLTTPKPLIPIAGKPIVQRLVEGIAKIVGNEIDEIAFVIGRNFGSEIEADLLQIAEDLNAKGTINYQDEALGTAHAVYAAAGALSGDVIVAFADTLFRADFSLDTSTDGTVWVQAVEDPRAFGVVQLDNEGIITDFVEKPENPQSDLAIIGIYYFKDGDRLKREIEFLLNNDIKEKGEYQLTNALDNMKNAGLRFGAGKVTEWWDCGNKNATVYANQRVLANANGEKLIADDLQSKDSQVIEPCFIGENVKLKNAKIGPYVSVGDNTVIEDSVIENSIIQSNSSLTNANLENSMLGNFVIYDGRSNQVSLSDYSTLKVD